SSVSRSATPSSCCPGGRCPPRCWRSCWSRWSRPPRACAGWRSPRSASPPVRRRPVCTGPGSARPAGRPPVPPPPGPRARPRVAVKRAKDATQLIAARRLLDAPKTAWRSVGGVALATFVASMTAAAAMFAGMEGADTMMADIGTGGQLTLVIAAVVAATSTGVMQAGRIIDQRAEYRALHLAGTDVALMDRARLREVAVPLVAAVLLATAAASVFLVPALGFALFTNPAAVGSYLVSVVGACLLVLAGSWASKGVVRTVLA